MQRSNDFADALGDEYQLLQYAYPHHDAFQQKVADTIAEHFETLNPERITVLEGGAGSGVTTSFLLTADPRITVVAVDNALKMLDQAKKILASQPGRMTFACEDLLAFLKSQPDASFDAFTAVWTIHNLQPDYRKKLFPEIYRVLKPKGIFVSGDKYTVADLKLHERQLALQLERFKEFGRSGNQALVDAWVQHNLEDEDIRISEKEQHDMLKKLGFTNVKTVYRKDMEAVIQAVK